ncbi:multidrug transporter subunit MdtN [Acetobacter sp. AN02]|uniref:multidrug transporter subunit MdtN n=1 Tax=Acetobacter sp. AN02 TaxID=2894186 RepID=UPI0024345524|nr:multidrug transporter subunit MdtN [Acetobacter sp. AN02]MDG6094746.1 multidrug transporter subunit MdtN [Acetobacter sp. AN02]
MKTVRTEKKSRIGMIIAVICIGAAIIYGIHVTTVSSEHPSTDDASIDAEVVHTASTVAGRLIELNVKLNQRVRKGDVLYRIDPRPYQLTVEEAEAGLALAEAQLANAQRSLSAKTSNAQAAAEQVRRTQDNRDLAARTVARLRPLAAQRYIPLQEFDTARVRLQNAETSLAQAKESQAAADVVIGDLNTALANRDARRAALDRARYELEQTTVIADHDGYITSLRVRTGEVLAPSRPLFTLITDNEWYASANFRETDLKQVHPGDCATVYSMINPQSPVRGTVESIGYGVSSLDTANMPGSLPMVVREMDWVRVAQRFPVRIRLENTHPELLRVGATATVEIRHGAACR